MVNLFFSNDFLLSYQRVTKFLFIIFFILSLKFIIINHKEYLKTIYKSWSLIFLIVIFDLAIEFLNGENLLGQKSWSEGRLGSFTGEESVIGNFFFRILSNIYSFNKGILKKNGSYFFYFNFFLLLWLF